MSDHRSDLADQARAPAGRHGRRRRRCARWKPAPGPQAALWCAWTTPASAAALAPEARGRRRAGLGDVGAAAGALGRARRAGAARPRASAPRRCSPPRASTCRRASLTFAAAGSAGALGAPRGACRAGGRRARRAARRPRVRWTRGGEHRAGTARHAGDAGAPLAEGTLPTAWGTDAARRCTRAAARRADRRRAGGGAGPAVRLRHHAHAVRPADRRLPGHAAAARA